MSGETKEPIRVKMMDGQTCPPGWLIAEYLPPLETICEDCKGTGTEREEGRNYACHKCGGAGHVPTDFGRQFVRFIEHQFKRMRREEG